MRWRRAIAEKEATMTLDEAFKAWADGKFIEGAGCVPLRFLEGSSVGLEDRLGNHVRLSARKLLALAHEGVVSTRVPAPATILDASAYPGAVRIGRPGWFGLRLRAEERPFGEVTKEDLAATDWVVSTDDEDVRGERQYFSPNGWLEGGE